ncbi:MAG TPA: NAD(P)/FAD-dependent oxidoreductase [Methylomirabilota bacterium]|nr:NAD(P)/FAD-dependent oxidoreductase [Methylomirabilota bacterium]
MPEQKYTEVPRQNPPEFHKPPNAERLREAIIIGGGLAGLSAAIYLGRAMRDAVLIDAAHSLALWEHDVQNYLGFPEGISGEQLLENGRQQALRYGATLVQDEIKEVGRDGDLFWARGKQGVYRGSRMLLCTGLYHVPPDIPEVNECLGKSMFFCKHCDGYRVQDKRILVQGANDEAVEYALGLMLYSPCVVIATNGSEPRWSPQHAAWIEEHEIPVHRSRILEVEQCGGSMSSVLFETGERVAIETLFTTRGDIYFNEFAKALGATVDEDGQVVVDEDMRTNVPGLYAAGCITPANCQMIIAAGQGATAAQAINRDLFEASLSNHSLRHYRKRQLREERTQPEVIAT